MYLSFPAQHDKARRFRTAGLLAGLAILALLLCCVLALSQSGKRSEQRINSSGVLISLVARRDDKSSTPISSKQLAVFDNNVQQDIKNLTRDPRPPASAAGGQLVNHPGRR
jgi:hypothetical protein